MMIAPRPFAGAASDLRSALLLAGGDRVTIHNTGGKLDAKPFVEQLRAIGRIPFAVTDERLGESEILRLATEAASRD